MATRRISAIQDLALDSGINIAVLRKLRDHGRLHDADTEWASRSMREKYSVSTTLFQPGSTTQALYAAGFSADMVREWARVI